MKKLWFAVLASFLGLTFSALGGGISPVAAVIDVDVSVSATSVECGRSVTITATVEDDGVDVPDGTDVTFTIGGQIVAVRETEDGEASLTFTTTEGFAGPLLVGATVGSASDSLSITVTCTVGGPPASVTLLITPSPLTCANQATILATVRDAAGRPVSSSVTVDFVASGNGSIIPSAPTINGVATSVYTAFPGTSGPVQITALVRGTAISTSATLQVVCPTAPTATARPPTAVPPTAVPPAPSTTIRPPSTGDAGLR